MALQEWWGWREGVVGEGIERSGWSGTFSIAAAGALLLLLDGQGVLAQHAASTAIR